MKSPTGRAATALVASTVMLGALSAPALGVPGTPIPAKQAGKVVAWGSEFHAIVPEDIAAKKIVAVAAGDWYNLTLDSTGQVEAWGDPGRAPVSEFPAEGLSNVKVMAGVTTNAIALKNDGTVVAWGSAATGINDVPAELTDVKTVDLSGFVGLAVRADGTVVRWGKQAATFPVPAGLTDVVDIDAGTTHTLALKSDGTVVGWGAAGTTPAPATVPAEIQGHVVAIGAGVNTSAAVTDDGKVHVWGTVIWTPPAELADEKVVDIAMEESIVVRTESGKVFAWGNPAAPDITAMTTIPEALDGEYVGAISAGERHNIAIMTPLQAVSAPTIAGTAKVGQTLTASDAEFSLEPESVATQWKADGQAIAGATGATLALTPAQVGKKITVTQTATRGGKTYESTSAPTTAVAPTQVASSVRASAGGVRYGVAPRVAVSLSPGSASGRVDVFRGASRVGSANAVGGRATVVLGRTALPVGTHTLSVRYAGNSATLPSSGSVRVSVAKAASGLRAKVSPKKIVRKKAKAKVAVTISSTSPVKSGKVTIKLGKKTIGKATVSRSGRVTVKLKKFPKAGTVRIKVIYSGNSTTTAVSKTIKVKIR